MVQLTWLQWWVEAPSNPPTLSPLLREQGQLQGAMAMLMKTLLALACMLAAATELGVVPPHLPNAQNSIAQLASQMAEEALYSF
jgi:hypothetical protein